MNEIHLKNIDLNLLLIFNCIYQERSLTIAGEHLGRTQSAISHSLDRLRKLFDDPLFVRTSKIMRPTPRAHELSVPIKKALATIQEALIPTASFSPERLEKTFIISMSDYCEMVILPSLMETLHQEAPQIKVKILSPATTGPQQGLESGVFDLVIGNRDVNSGIFQQRLYEDEFVCMVSKNHPEIQHKITHQQYLDASHILFSPQGNEDRLEKDLKKLKIKRNVALKVPDIMVIPYVLKKTPFIVTFQRKLAEALKVDYLQILKPPVDLPKIPIMQYWHEAMNNDPAHRWLRKVIHTTQKK